MVGSRTWGRQDRCNAISNTTVEESPRYWNNLIAPARTADCRDNRRADREVRFPRAGIIPPETSWVQRHAVHLFQIPNHGTQCRNSEPPESHRTIDSFPGANGETRYSERPAPGSPWNRFTRYRPRRIAAAFERATRRNEHRRTASVHPVRVRTLRTMAAR